MKRRGLNKAQLALKSRVVNAYTKRGGFRYIHPTWDKKLWKKPTSDIYEFLEGRFRETLDVVEYYSAMVLLWKTIPNKELLVDFHDSPQWRKAAKTYNSGADGEGTSQPLKEKNTLNRNEQRLTKVKYIEANGIKNITPIQFIGDKK